MNELFERHRRTLAIVLVAIVVVASIAAWYWYEETRPIQITLTYSNKVDYESLIIAIDQGYFKDEGLNVTTKIVVGGIQSAEAIATGAADIGAMGDAPAVIVASRGYHVKIVARYSGGERMHRIIAWTDITSPKDLEGKKVGIQFGSSTQGAFIRWAETNGLNISKVQLVNIQPTDMPEAMKTRQIDAMAGSEPWPTNVEKMCGQDVYELGTSSGLGSNFPMVLVASDKLIQEKPEAIVKVIKAIMRASDYIRDHPDDAASIASGYTGLSLEDEKRCMGDLFWEVGLNQTDVESLTLTANFLKGFGTITEIPDIASFIDRTCLEKAVEEYGS